VCFGSSRVGAESPAARSAETVGRILAERGITVLSGGYDGVMDAVSRGATEAGGAAIGVTTPIFPRRDPSRHLTAQWTEPDYLARLATLVRQAHGFVALPGGLGTLSEWVTAWVLLTIRQAPGPLFLFEDPWRPVFEAILAVDEVDPAHAEHVHWLRDAADLAPALDAGVR